MCTLKPALVYCCLSSYGSISMFSLSYMDTLIVEPTYTSLLNALHFLVLSQEGYPSCSLILVLSVLFPSRTRRQEPTACLQCHSGLRFSQRYGDPP